MKILRLGLRHNKTHGIAWRCDFITTCSFHCNKIPDFTNLYFWNLCLSLIIRIKYTYSIQKFNKSLNVMLFIKPIKFKWSYIRIVQIEGEQNYDFLNFYNDNLSFRWSPENIKLPKWKVVTWNGTVLMELYVWSFI